MLSPQRLKEKILKDRYNSMIFKKFRGQEIYIVGGYIRDILRGKVSKDRDFIIKNDVQDFAGNLEKILKGTKVEFKKGDTIRVVLKNGITMDFSRLKGSITEDLSMRDFTINAIAWSPETGLIDPYKGLRDIEKRVIRSINKNNLLADPLRMLRAYRLASELNGSIDLKTRGFIKTFYNNLEKVSTERITFEIFNLLNSKNPGKYLNMALNDKILKHIFPLNIKDLRNNIKVIYKFSRQVEGYPEELKAILEENFSQNLTYMGLLILELLTAGNGISRLDKFPLRMSNLIIKRILLSNKGLEELKKGDLFNFFLNAKESSMDVILLKNKLKLIEEYIRYKKIWKNGIMSPLEIKKITKIKEGLMLGRIILEIKRAEFNKVLKRKREAKEYLYKILHNISYQT